MISYKLLPNDPFTGQPRTFIRRLPDNLDIPMVEDNRDYQEYLKWLADGNQPLPADE